MNRNRIDLSQRRKDAKFNSTNYLCELCGFARKFFAIKCIEFILNVLSYEGNKSIVMPEASRETGSFFNFSHEHIF
jgi:hypothetical protein